MSVKSGFVARGVRYRPTKDPGDPTDVWRTPVDEIRLNLDDESSEVFCTSHDPSLDVSDLSEYHRMLRPGVRALLEGRGHV